MSQSPGCKARQCQQDNVAGDRLAESLTIGRGPKHICVSEIRISPSHQAFAVPFRRHVCATTSVSRRMGRSVFILSGSLCLPSSS